MIVAAETRRPNTRHRASPRARRLLHEAGLREHDVAGTGPDGRILRADVEAVAAARRADGPEHWRENHLAAAAQGISPANTPPDRAPAFMAVEVDFHAVDRVRRAAAGPTLGHLPYVARAVVDALAAFPYLNAQLGDQTVLVQRPVHLGIAVDLDPDGLVVPVVRDADSLRLASLGQRLTAAIDEVRAGWSVTDDAGGTFTLGTFTFGNPAPQGTLLIAPPLAARQVAALATGAVRAKPVAIEREPGEYVVAVHPVGTLGLSFDHRAVDTGYAARFLDRIRDALETRDWAAEL